MNGERKTVDQHRAGWQREDLQTLWIEKRKEKTILLVLIYSTTQLQNQLYLFVCLMQTLFTISKANDNIEMGESVSAGWSDNVYEKFQELLL